MSEVTTLLDEQGNFIHVLAILTKMIRWNDDNTAMLVT